MQITNLALKFVEFYNKIDLTDNEDVILSAFQNHFDQEIYYQMIFKGLHERGQDIASFLKQKLEAFSEIQDRFTELAEGFESLLSEVSEKFKHHFADFSFSFDIIAGHSLGTFDGGIREDSNGNPFFVFGFDVMALVYEGIRMTPFLMHELFHVYHHKHYTPLNEASILDDLWSEGLATYFSHISTPDSTRQEILLDIPQGLIEKTRENIKLLCKMLLENLETKDTEIYTRFFLGPFNEINFRSGYYIGYLFASFINRDYILEEMVHLSGERLLTSAKTFLNRCITDFASIESDFLNV